MSPGAMLELQRIKDAMASDPDCWGYYRSISRRGDLLTIFRYEEQAREWYETGGLKVNQRVRVERAFDTGRSRGLFGTLLEFREMLFDDGGPESGPQRPEMTPGAMVRMTEGGLKGVRWFPIWRLEDAS